MKKLIEIQQESLIVCDTQDCDFTIPYSEKNADYLLLFIDQKCPKCDANLLTREDYLQSERLMRVVNWINKYFSWLTLFYSKKAKQNPQSVTVHVHNGIKIEIVKSDFDSVSPA